MGRQGRKQRIAHPFPHHRLRPLELEPIRVMNGQVQIRVRAQLPAGPHQALALLPIPCRGLRHSIRVPIMVGILKGQQIPQQTHPRTRPLRQARQQGAHTREGPPQPPQVPDRVPITRLQCLQQGHLKRRPRRDPPGKVLRDQRAEARPGCLQHQVDHVVQITGRLQMLQTLQTWHQFQRKGHVTGKLPDRRPLAQGPAVARMLQRQIAHQVRVRDITEVLFFPAQAADVPLIEPTGVRRQQAPQIVRAVDAHPEAALLHRLGKQIDLHQPPRPWQQPSQQKPDGRVKEQRIVPAGRFIRIPQTQRQDNRKTGTGGPQRLQCGRRTARFLITMRSNRR